MRGACVFVFLQTDLRHTYRAAHRRPCKATLKAREQTEGLPPIENCDQCRTSVSEIMLCLGCHQARYCSAACQRDAWFVVVFFVALHCWSICPLICKLINNFHTQLKGGSQETVQEGPERTRHGRGDSARGRGCSCGRRRCAMLRALQNSLSQLASVHGLPLGVVLQHELPTRSMVLIVVVMMLERSLFWSHDYPFYPPSRGHPPGGQATGLCVGRLRRARPKLSPLVGK